MTKPQTVNVNIPFPGFYESLYSQAIDSEESQWLEYHGEEQGETGPDYESNWPEALNLSDASYPESLWNILHKHSDYSAAYARVAAWYVEAFDSLCGKAFGMTRPDVRKVYDWQSKKTRREAYRRPSIGLVFETMTSPREYNFQTDRLFADVPLKVMRELFKRSAADNHAKLSHVIRQRFTSRDGFSSFYSNNLADWIAKPLREWDHNEFGTLIIAALQVAGVDLERVGGPYGELYESTMGDEGAYQAWSDCVDWPAFDSSRNEARGELFAEWAGEDPDAAREWIKCVESEFVTLITDAAPDIVRALLGLDESLPVRCPWTPDLFATDAAGQIGLP